MLILENKGSSETLNKIYDAIKKNIDNENYEFDETIDGINFWGTDDVEKTVFINSDDGYATITKSYLEDKDSCIDSIRYQLNGTEEQEEAE